MRSSRLKWMCSPALAAMLACSSLAAAPDEPGLSSGEERGFTLPSDERELAFNIPGLISDVPVTDGQAIKKGQLLAGQDESIELARLKMLKVDAESDLQERAAVADRDQKLNDLERKQKMFDKGGGSATELEEAKLAVTIAEIRIELAVQERLTKQLEVEEHIEKMKLKKMLSPFDGEVRKVEAAAGEIADPQKPSIIVVRNDPLWVEVKLPVSITKRLKPGQEMQVRYLDERQWHSAKIILLDRVADPTSGTHMLHLEMANKDNRFSGQEVAVKLPEMVAGSAKSE